MLYLRAWRLRRMQLSSRRRWWNQTQVAERAGVRQATLSDLELGKKRPRRTTLEALARALGASPEELRKPPPEVR